MRHISHAANKVNEIDRTLLAYSPSMDSRQHYSNKSQFNATSTSSPHHRQASSHHGSQRPQRPGNHSENDTRYHHSSAENPADIRPWQGQSSTGPNYQTSAQWTQQQQQQPWGSWGSFNTGYSSAAAFPQTQFQNYLPTQQQTWQQQYPQYGHINPAFLPQQPVANIQYPANDNSRHRGSDTSYGAAYNEGQQRGYDYDYDYHHWSNNVPMANNQSSQAAAGQQHNNRYGAHFYENTISQPQRQSEQASYYAGGPATARPAAFPATERYDNRVSQLEGLMNPLYMRSPQLTPPGGNPRLYVLPRPTPSASYLEQAQLPPRRLSNPKKLLIVLDLNGTLLVRSNRGSNYTPRPHVDEFLAYCLEHHALIVWSSARLQNVTAMVAQLFTAEQRQKLVKIWSRNELRLGKYFDAKVQVYKQLTWLWEDSEVQASFPMPATLPFRFEDGWKDSLPTKWDQSNTVLLDDSVDKAASEPHNLLQVDEFTKENIGDGEDALGRVLAYIEALKWEADVSAAMRARPFVNGQGEVWNWGTVERPPSA
jgi:hypothetical protein